MRQVYDVYFRRHPDEYQVKITGVFSLGCSESLSELLADAIAGVERMQGDAPVVVWLCVCVVTPVG